ncbi:MAG TPA: hypothetical protein VFI42_07605 [Thermomicrobiaceae bacterium]|nr:hypothetical protein [Thermomicrobiaceae bacterium]
MAQLVEAQQGTIVVESEPGRGTTLRFTLPLAGVPGPRAPAARDATLAG